jgi:hypothetical protein
MTLSYDQHLGMFRIEHAVYQIFFPYIIRIYPESGETVKELVHGLEFFRNVG